MLDFNHKHTLAEATTKHVNELIDLAIDMAATYEQKRPYLGASALGHDCLRKVQWDWTEPSSFPARIRRIFTRGHWWEDYLAKLLKEAGFRIVRGEVDRLAFSQLDGTFKGHADGMIIAGPDVAGTAYPCLWECKCLGSRGWNKLSKDGLRRAYPGYYVQVQIYMAYLGLHENPALFSAGNADTGEILHILVPFDPATAQEWSDKAVQIIQAQQAGETLPRAAANPEDWRCKFCNHKEKCWGQNVGEDS